MADNEKKQQQQEILVPLVSLENEIGRGDFVGKVLIATFDDEEEIDFEELILFLKKKSNIVLMNTC